MGKVKIVNVDNLLLDNRMLPTERSGGVPLFNFVDSVRLLGLCESLAIGVLGIEGFTLDGDILTPDMNYISDFSTLLKHTGFERKSVEFAQKFLIIAKVKSDLLFEYLLANYDN
jgi:hypothetical protein